MERHGILASELGRTEEATAAAHQAKLSARTAEERGIASALEYTTKTDFHVQFEREENGEMKAVTYGHLTARVEPVYRSGRPIERTNGELRSVQCKDGRLVGFSVDTPAGLLQLDVPDPTHVLMRNSPSEFSCGPQQPRTVKLEYAESTAKRGPLLRGMDFE